MLENHGHAVADLPQLLITAGGQILSLYQHGAFGRLFQEIQAAYQSTFSCAGHTDNSVDIPSVDFQADTLEGFHPAVLRFK